MVPFHPYLTLTSVLCLEAMLSDILHVSRHRSMQCVSMTDCNAVAANVKAARRGFLDASHADNLYMVQMKQRCNSFRTWASRDLMAIPRFARIRSRQNNVSMVVRANE